MDNMDEQLKTLAGEIHRAGELRRQNEALLTERAVDKLYAVYTELCMDMDIGARARGIIETMGMCPEVKAFGSQALTRPGWELTISAIRLKGGFLLDLPYGIRDRESFGKYMAAQKITPEMAESAAASLEYIREKFPELEKGYYRMLEREVPEKMPYRTWKEALTLHNMPLYTICLTKGQPETEVRMQKLRSDVFAAFTALLHEARGPVETLLSAKKAMDMEQLDGAYQKKARQTRMYSLDSLAGAPVFRVKGIGTVFDGKSIGVQADYYGESLSGTAFLDLPYSLKEEDLKDLAPFSQFPARPAPWKPVEEEMLGEIRKQLEKTREAFAPAVKEALEVLHETTAPFLALDGEPGQEPEEPLDRE